jgi:hypothetical protein
MAGADPREFAFQPQLLVAAQWLGGPRRRQVVDGGIRRLHCGRRRRIRRSPEWIGRSRLRGGKAGQKQHKGRNSENGLPVGQFSNPSQSQCINPLAGIHDVSKETSFAAKFTPCCG